MNEIDQSLCLGGYSTLISDGNFLQIKIQEKSYREDESLNKYRFHIIVNFFDALKLEDSIGVLKLQIRHLEKDKKEMFLTAVNWETSKRCSTVGNTANIVDKNIDSELLVWINRAGQMNVVLDSQKADLKCWTNPWFDPVKIRVTGLDMIGWKAEQAAKLDDFFDIRYEIQDRDKRKF